MGTGEGQPVSNPPDSGKEVDDALLVQRIQAGDRSAFDRLVLRHQQEVFAVALRMLGDWHEASDVAQDAFVRAYQAIGTFRGQAKVSTWLVSITMNLCRNRRRWWARRRRVIIASLDDPDETGDNSLAQEVADPAPSPVQDVQSRERERLIADVLQRVDEVSRSVIVLRDIQGYTYEEIAQVTGLSLGTVKSRISRARRQLRALLDGKL